MWVCLILVDFMVCSCCGSGGRRCWVAVVVVVVVVVGGDVGGGAGSVWLAVMGYQLQRL